MKNITLLMLLFVCMFESRAQKLEIRDVPLAVRMAFKTANPSVVNPEWRKDKCNYQAKCTVNKRPQTYTYTKTGTMIVHDGKVAVAILPPGIKEYLDKNYPGAPVDKVLKMTKPDGIVNYNIEVSNTDLFFDSNGKYLKSLKRS